MLHRFAKFVAACTVLLVARRQPRHEHRLRSVGSRLADDLRLEHVHVPALEVGRRHLLRARPSADRQHRRLPHHRPRRLALARRAAPLDEAARRRGARRGHPAGRARRPDGAVLPARADLDRARRPGRDLLLPDGRDRALHVARLARAATTRVDDAMLRRVATTTTALIYAQILVGATMRHTDAGLAIPDFPLMFGGLVPDHWRSEDRRALRPPRRRAHRHARRSSRRRRTSGITTAAARELTRPAALLVALVAVQVTLGALTVLSAARRLDQQRARRLRRAGAGDVAGAHAAQLAGAVRASTRLAAAPTPARRADGATADRRRTPSAARGARA